MNKWKIVNVDLLSVFAVDYDCMCHASRHFFYIIKHKSVCFHEATVSISLEELVRMMTVEEYFAISTSEQWDWERNLIEHIIVKSTSE